jgi:hypothetical protein
MMPPVRLLARAEVLREEVGISPVWLEAVAMAFESPK